MIANTLLCTLGTAWQVVAEAFIRKQDAYRRVAVFTTASDKIKVDEVFSFFARYPTVQIVLTRIEGLADITTSSDQEKFDELLYRWFLAECTTSPVDVCLAGGYKTMSASMQQVARLFGAANVFHVLADLSIQTADDIIVAHNEDRLHYIDLGGEQGWPQLLNLRSADFPLSHRSNDDRIVWVTCDDHTLRAEVRHVLAESQQAAAETANLPFPAIALWPRSNRLWLESPLCASTDAAWIAALPKVELHCHLGGFASYGDELQRVRNAADPNRSDWSDVPTPPLHWPWPLQPIALRNYMHLGDATGRHLLKSAKALQTHCELLYRHLQQQNILYAEIRCSPNNYCSEGRSAWTVLSEIRGHFARCRALAEQHAQVVTDINLILIATRRQGGDRSDISRHLALAITAAQHWSEGVRVVGVDLAGFEAPETRAALYQTDFTPVHRVGLAVTVHAGENDDAEGIWQAVFQLNARRLGHALHLGEAPDLLRAVADRGIGVEMCPMANYQIHGFQPMSGRPTYPLLDYLQEGVCVTVNTDNPGISAASLGDNLLALERLCPGIRRLHVLQLLRNALDVSFLQKREKQQLLRRFHKVLCTPIP